MKKTVTALCLLLVLLLSSSPALADEDLETSSIGIVIDVVLVRPIGIASIAIGAGGFVISLPFSLPTKSADVAAKKLVGDPFKFTFMRPVGELEDY